MEEFGNEWTQIINEKVCVIACTKQGCRLSRLHLIRCLPVTLQMERKKEVGLSAPFLFHAFIVACRRTADHFSKIPKSGAVTNRENMTRVIVMFLK